MNASRASAGFTLLEVLVAIAILGLGMTSILSAQAGLFASSSYAERVSLATGMVRCKTSELELKLAKEGYPLLDMHDEGACCADEPTTGYTCKWKIEKVELPPPPLSTDLSSKMGALMSGAGSLGGIGAIAGSGQTGGSVLDNGAGLSDLSKLLAGQSPLAAGAAGAAGIGAGLPGGTPPTSPTDTFGSTPFGSTGFGNAVPGTTPLGATPPAGGGLGSAMGGGTSSLAPLVMGMVYPTLKPMLEASIRKLTVKVEWPQGAKTRDLEIVEFVANPQQGGIDPNAAQGLDGLSGALNSLLPGLSGGTGTKTK